MPPPATLLDAALAYAARGWHVFPLSPRSKVPLPGTRGLLEATTDAAQIRAWWQADAARNVGLALAPSGLVALDADGADWRAKIAALEELHGALPRTLVQHSGGGIGIHALYRAPSYPIRGQLGGITLRGRNYLVVSPSVHPSGGAYVWHDPRVEVAELPPAWCEAMRRRTDVDAADADIPDHGTEPEWLHRITAEERLAAARTHLEREPGERMGESRHGMTWDVTRTLVRGYAIRDAGAAFEILRDVYNPRCVPPWPEARLARHVETAYTAGLPEWGAALRPWDPRERLGFTPDAPPETPPPNETELRATLNAAAAKASRSTRAERKLVAAYLRRVLTGKAIAAPGDDPATALAQACVVVVASAPRGTTDVQIASVLARSTIGTAPEALLAAIADARATIAQPVTASDDEFEVETVGPRAGQPSASSQRNVDVALKKLGVRVRFDELCHAVTIARGEESPERATDTAIVGLQLEIDRDFGFRVSKDFFFDVVNDRARADPFHPVRDYLDGLRWDGTPRLDGWLSHYAQAPDTPYTRAVGRLVLIAAVRRARSPGCKFDEMLVLESKQGSEKSSALRVLAVRDEWFGDDLPLGGDGKRQIEAIAGKWIVECAELTGIRRAEVADLKSFLSRQIDEARLAYERLTSTHPRQCVIVGSTNDQEYLRDATGNRRFWPVPVGRFDVHALRVDRDQLWAEAAHLEAEGASIRLAPDLWADAAREQDDRRVEDPFVELLEAHLGTREGKVRTIDVWRLLRIDPAEATPEQVRRLGDALRVLGWERSRRRFDTGAREYCYVRGDAGKEVDLSGLAGARALPVEK